MMKSLCFATWQRRVLLVALAALASGCASVAPREVAVRAQLPATAVWSAGAWGGALPTPSTPTGEAPGATAPLTADDAVRIAFTTSPQARALRAGFLSEVAAIDTAAAPGGLHLSWARLSPAEGLAKLALALAVPLDEWLTLPARQQVGYWARAAAAQRAAYETLRLESRVREAWATAVAGQRRAALLARAAETAELAAELATRYREAGNLAARAWNERQQAAALALTAAAEAGVAAAESRAALANLLGIPSTDPRLMLPEGLPAAPPMADAAASLEPAQVAGALRQRLDLLAARSEVLAHEAAARSSRRWSRLPAASAGVERERETDGERLTGPQLDLSWSPAGLAMARGATADAELAAARAATLAVEVANEVRWRTLAYKRALDVDGLLAVQLAKLQTDHLAEAQREHAFMLTGPFDLLEQRAVADELAASAEQQRLAAWSAWFALQQATGVAP